MKIIRILKCLNSFEIGLPITLLMLGLAINDSAGDYISYALYSTMLTGLIQVLFSLFLLFYNTENKYLQIYIATVIIFFKLWYIDLNICYSGFLSLILFPIPLILSIYFSTIIYKKNKNELLNCRME